MGKTKRVKSSLAKRNMQKFLSNRLAMVGLVLLVVVLILTFGAPLFTHYDPEAPDINARYQPPSEEHMLGADNIGRDTWSRALYGGQFSIIIGVLGAIGTSILAVVLGCVSGYYGGKVDAIIVYISEIFYSFPQLLLVFILVGFVGRGWVNLVFIFAFTGWIFGFRIVRSKILSLKQETFIESCKANGIGGMSIMFRHMLPNTLGPVIVNATLSTAGFVLQEAALSFIGLGVEAGIPTWGNLINSAKGMDTLQNYPWLWIVPGVAISLFVLSINFFGDGLRDVYDPGQ